MRECDLIFISQSDIINQEEYSRLPIDRIELFRSLIFPRMVYFKGGFRHTLDVINYFRSGTFYADADYKFRKKMLNIWNLPGFNGHHITGYLHKHGIRCRHINNFDSDWDIFRDVYEKSADKPLVGISTTFHLSYAEIRRMTKRIRQAYPEAKIIIGGAFVNEQSINEGVDAFQGRMRKYRVDYLLHAFNSEIDLKELIMALKNGSNLREVNNLCFFENGDIEKGSFVSTRLLWNDPVLRCGPLFHDRPGSTASSGIFQIRTSSGCPFNCAFCSYPVTAGGFHTADGQDVGLQIGSIAAMPGINKIIFIDDTLNVPVGRFKEILGYLKTARVEWFSFLRAQFLDEDMVKLMQESGCKAVYLGVESASDIILKNMNKRATRSEYLRGIALLKKYGICTVSAIILGFPGETKMTLQEDVDFIESSGTDYYTLKEFYYMKHSDIYKFRAHYGLEGMGSDWKHDTMDRKTASEAKLEMFTTIKNSIFIDPDTSLWYLAYLYDQGFEFNAIRNIQRMINSVIKEQVSGKIYGNDEAFKDMSSLV